MQLMPLMNHLFRALTIFKLLIDQCLMLLCEIITDHLTLFFNEFVCLLEYHGLQVLDSLLISLLHLMQLLLKLFLDFCGDRFGTFVPISRAQHRSKARMVDCARPHLRVHLAFHDTQSTGITLAHALKALHFAHPRWCFLHDADSRVLHPTVHIAGRQVCHHIVL